MFMRGLCLGRVWMLACMWPNSQLDGQEQNEVRFLPIF